VVREVRVGVDGGMYADGGQMDAQLEVRVEGPSHQSVVCMGMHMWYRVPGLESGEDGEASEGSK
jgi:hypothetical protein